MGRPDTEVSSITVWGGGALAQWHLNNISMHRLPVIVLEDSTLHPNFGLLVWLMVAESKVSMEDFLFNTHQLDGPAPYKLWNSFKFSVGVLSLHVFNQEGDAGGIRAGIMYTAR
jgi:hypothetical protein